MVASLEGGGVSIPSAKAPESPKSPWPVETQRFSLPKHFEKQKRLLVMKGEYARHLRRQLVRRLKSLHDEPPPLSMRDRSRNAKTGWFARLAVAMPRFGDSGDLGDFVR